MYVSAALIKFIHTVTNMLEYIIVYAINFSKAFDTERHNELLGKYSKDGIAIMRLQLTSLTSFKLKLTAYSSVV